ncbi:hypothetical protein LEP1GSC178_2018 [Leptospira licerasiae str. MMD4847]|uniref:Uncharacterized protein n=1 Tax=Leptospira licerasiae str. MMD4847 TaxID=1049971 RepID=A0ABN0HE12_9LEPT|nr:hypothetical protein LEP1GSC178_2018 [Leptospira licerasiae str. MMD4847]
MLFVPVGMVAGTGNVGEYSFFFLLLLSLIASIIIEFPFYHFSVYKLGELELSKLIFFGYLVCIHLVSYLILVGSFFAFR